MATATDRAPHAMGRQQGRVGLFDDRAMTNGHHMSQTKQRVRVGMVGLAAIVLLIGLASAIIGSLTRDRAPATRAAQPQVVANMTMSNADAPVAGSEPLAELGVAPSASNSVSPNAR